MRAAIEDDSDRVIAIWNDAFVFSGTGGRDKPYAPDDFLAILTGAELAVAERDHAVLGTIALLGPKDDLPTIAFPDEVQLSMLAVGPSSRRRGIARILLAWAHGRALRLRASALVLYTLPDQVEAHELYRSLGYRRWPERDAGRGGQLRMVYRLDLRSNRPRRVPRDAWQVRGG